MPGPVIRGIGTDIVAVDRVADLLTRHADRFLGRCFRPDEVGRIHGHTDPATVAAAHWAAKEAFLKALGTEVSAIAYRDIEVTHSEKGQATLRVHGRAAQALGADGRNTRVFLSLAHDRRQAVALVLIEQSS